MFEFMTLFRIISEAAKPALRHKRFVVNIKNTLKANKYKLPLFPYVYNYTTKILFVNIRLKFN